MVVFKSFSAAVEAATGPNWTPADDHELRNLMSKAVQENTLDRIYVETKCKIDPWN